MWARRRWTYQFQCRLLICPEIPLTVFWVELKAMNMDDREKSTDNNITWLASVLCSILIKKKKKKGGKSTNFYLMHNFLSRLFTYWSLSTVLIELNDLLNVNIQRPPLFSFLFSYLCFFFFYYFSRFYHIFEHELFLNVELISYVHTCLWIK